MEVLQAGGGAKKTLLSYTATKNSTGRYTVYHSVGHSNYQIIPQSHNQYLFSSMVFLSENRSGQDYLGCI